MCARDEKDEGGSIPREERDKKIIRQEHGDKQGMGKGGKRGGGEREREKTGGIARKLIGIVHGT